MMKLVQKGNRQLRVQEDRLEAMLAAGYTEVDEKTGKLLTKKPVDEGATLKKENTALKKENKELHEKLAALSAQLGEAKN